MNRDGLALSEYGKICYIQCMGRDHKVIIDMDILMEDSNVLEKFHECANLMIISSNREEVELGYNMLEIVDDCMSELKKQ